MSAKLLYLISGTVYLSSHSRLYSPYHYNRFSFTVLLYANFAKGGIDVTCGYIQGIYLFYAIFMLFCLFVFNLFK